LFFFLLIEESPNSRRKRNYQQSEADRWLKQAQHDLESSYSDMHSSTGQAAYDWACYKCYRVGLGNRNTKVFRVRVLDSTLPNAIFCEILASKMTPVFALSPRYYVRSS
jgi:hypothetical protein